MVRLLAAVVAIASVAAGQVRTPPVRPTEMQKAIEEFRVQTRNLGLRADSPTRKKSNQSRYHGRLFYNLRNDILDAIPHEIRQGGSNKSLLRRGQFGFNVAGPLVVPAVVSSQRTFVSISYEGVRERISRSYLRTVPIGPERSGDYSAVVDQAGQPLQIYDPLTTRINADFDPSKPVSRENLQYLRDPFPQSRIPAHRLNAAAQAAVRLYPEANTSIGPFNRNNYFVVSPETNTANGMIFKVDHTLSDRQRLDSTVSFSNGLAGYADYMPTIADSSPSDRTFASRRMVLQHTFAISPRTVHTFGAEVNSDVNRAAAAPFPVYSFSSTYLPMGRSNPVSKNAHNYYEVRNGVASKRGRHSFRLGSEYTKYEANILSAQYPDGSFRFGSGLTSLPGIINTGHPFASFLLGGAEFAERSVILSPSYFRRHRFIAFARDQYEVRRNFTINLGLNFTVNTPRTEKYNRQSTIHLDLVNPANGRPGALVAAGQDGMGNAFQPLRARLEPQMGIAWNPLGDNRSVVRVSYSRAYQATPFGSGQWGTQGFNAYPTWISPNVQLTPARVLDGESLPAAAMLPDLRPEAANDTVADLVDMSERQSRTQAVSASIEREVPGAVIITVGAAQSDGKNLMVGNSAANPNAIPADALSYRDRLNDENFRRSLRPYPQFQAFDVNGLYPTARYHRAAGYLRVEKRTSAGLGLTAVYEFSKQMDDYSGPYGVQDFYNRDNEWSLTAGNNPHRFSLNYVYELPSLGLFSDWRRHIVEGWAISGMTSMASGDPLALRPQFNNTGGVISALNVNVVPGVSPEVADPSPALWYNPGAFEQPADFTTGNASRTHPYLLGPGSQNHDLSITKRFPLDAERAVELSAVGFNFVNHANWNDPDVVIGPSSSPNVNAGKIIGSRGGRIIQVGLRYSF